MGLGESVVDYSRINMDIQKYYPIVLNASFCFRTFAVANFGPIIPFYAHQYYGYGERIRGYFYEIMEGENIWGFSTEIRVPILGPKYYVIEDFPIPEFSILRYALCFNIFYDAGEVWNRKDFMFNKIKSGFGFGLNFLLPYSVVLRAEYGFNQKLKGEFIFDAGVSF
jgi:hemolysin activation/secretion protein